MPSLILTAATFCVLFAAVQITSIAIAIVRLRRKAPPHLGDYSPVSLVRPLCGIDNYAAETLLSTFELDYPRCEILFCVADTADPILPLVKDLIAAYPTVAARLLIGNDRVSANPKLNNVVKGWRAASHDWVVIADSNVLMPRDYIQRLFASWRADTGLVASPPIGSHPQGFWAEIECAFLNTYQARAACSAANTSAKFRLHQREKPQNIGHKISQRYLVLVDVQMPSVIARALARRHLS